jgi:hypothetical protein
MPLHVGLSGIRSIPGADEVNSCSGFLGFQAACDDEAVKILSQSFVQRHFRASFCARRV